MFSAAKSAEDEDVPAPPSNSNPIEKAVVLEHEQGSAPKRTPKSKPQEENVTAPPPRQKKCNLAYCGVPQCNTYKGNGITMHQIPKEVRDSKILLKKWSIALRMGKPFPKYFLICSRHFKKEEILVPARRAGIGSRTYISKAAFPTQNLPKSSVPAKNKIDRGERLLALSIDILNPRNTNMVEEEFRQMSESSNEEPGEMLDNVQLYTPPQSKGIQVNVNPFIALTSSWDTDKKLNAMTGLPDMHILNTLVKACLRIRTDDKACMSMKDRILLTFFKLKTNSTLPQLAVLFLISEKMAKVYFADTIQLLAKVTKCLIYWQTRYQNIRSLPACFEQFSNVRTVLDYTEMRTVNFRCLTCRTCTYSQCEGSHTLKVLIGVSPSGAINFLSKVVTGKSADNAIFNLTDLTEKLQPGDAVMVGKGFIIGDKLSKAGIEVIRPELNLGKVTKQDVERNSKITAARVHVERRIARLKIFKVLSNKVHVSMLPYMDDIMVVLCGLSNLSSPIISDDKFWGNETST